MLQRVFPGNIVKCPCKTMPALTEEQLENLLKKADKNGDGRLSKEELKEVFRGLADLFPGWRAQRALGHADKNGDGYISQEELQQLVVYARKQKYKSPGCPCNKRRLF